MIFLIDYDRIAGRIVKMRSFDSAERIEANSARIELELKLNRDGIQREIVLLEAADEDALRKTHRRYFEDLSELMRTSAG